MLPIVLAFHLSFFLQRGFCYTSWRHNGYLTPEADSSLLLLRELNTTDVALLVTWYQDSAPSPFIYPSWDSTPSDTSLTYAINKIHSLNMRVTLKLHIDCKNGKWRGEIEPDREGVWFRNYLSFLKHYAKLAERTGVEILNIGTELEGTTQNYESEWRRMIDTVRRYYSGSILYGANWDRYQTHVHFWDALDFIGISAFFPLTNLYDPTLEDLLNAWQNRWLSSLESFQRQIGKPIIFSEIGYRSVDGANMRPWEWQTPGPVDTAEQRDCYEAAFITFFSLPWTGGFYIWNWTTNPNQGGPNDDGYSVNSKPAAQVIRDWYGRNEIRGRDLLCFPNPFRNRAQFLMRYSPPKELRIYDIKGTLVAKILFNRRWEELSLNHLPTGVYIARVGNSSFKFIRLK